MIKLEYQPLCPSLDKPSPAVHKSTHASKLVPPTMVSCNTSLSKDDKMIFSTDTSTVLAFTAMGLSLTGFVLNLLIILALLTSRRLRSVVTTPLIVGVALGDFLWSSLILPVLAIRFYTRSWDTVGSCSFFPVMELVILGASVLCLMFITINRTCLLFFKERVAKMFTIHISILLIFLSWIFPLLLLAPSITGTWGRIGLDNLTQGCLIMEDTNGESPLVIFNDLIFIIPFITMFICIILDFVKLCTGTKVEKTTMSEYLFILMLLLIFLMFLLCFLPGFLLSKMDNCYSYPILHAISYMTIWSCVIITPTIILSTQRSYRNAVIVLAKRLAGCLEQDQEGEDKTKRMSRMMVTNYNRQASNEI